jgi:hypothetical protein
MLHRNSEEPAMRQPSRLSRLQQGAGMLTISAAALSLVNEESVAQSGQRECYANCDGSTTEPILNANDFLCFVNEFVAALALPHAEQVQQYANCDGSTASPALTVDDFICFINSFATGCAHDTGGGAGTQGDCPSEPCDPEPALF